MFKNNNERLNVWMSLRDKFDYAEFCEQCSIMAIVPQGAFEFAQRAGVLQCAVKMYPNVTVQDAHSLFLTEHQKVLVPNFITEVAASQSASTSGGCGNCGGGAVR